MPTSILHLPYNQGNFVSSLQYAERELGATSMSAAPSNIFTEPPDLLLTEDHWRSLKTIRTYFRARRMNILVFNYGASLFNVPFRRWFLLDLPFYPENQKKIMFFQGSDARIAYGEHIEESRHFEKSLGNVLAPATKDGFITQEEISLKQEKADKIDRYIDRIFYFNPDLSTGLPRRAKFIPYPFLPTSQSPILKIDRERPLRVLHLSTNRVLKGTGLIERALEITKKGCEGISYVEGRWVDI